MAEERFIDEDKDRKYRIRINENGDEELVVIDDEEEEDDFPEYEVEVDGDSQLSEEELAAKREERRQNMQRKAEQLKATAREKLAEGDFESAQYALFQASELTEYDGELYYLQLKAYSRNMTEFFDLQRCVDAAEGVKEYSEAEQKSELAAMSGALDERIAQFEKQREELGAENEAGKAERRGLFAAKRKTALTLLVATGVPFAVFATLAIVFASMIFANSEGLFIVLTAVFAGAAVVALFATLFTLTRFLEANRKVRLNESDTATNVGREFASVSEELENLKKIKSAVENDIS